ncbi:hypothetical protein CR513_63126, partial [Mucuna pruriens]
MDWVFKGSLGRNIEVKKKKHYKALKDMFETLKKYKLKLNHKKCLFGGTNKEVLRFYTDQERDRGESRKVQSHYGNIEPNKC